MFAEQLASAIDVARPSQLDEIARALWGAHGAGLVTDEDAERLATAIEARRALGKAPASKPAPRRVGSRPKTEASLQRRRRWVASGLLPPQLACEFTAGECAALAVIAVEVQKRGRCDLVIGAIAATAGVCATTVRNALRRARQIGLLVVEERRLTWTRNLPNRITIVSPEWCAWLRLGAKEGGCKSVRRTPTSLSKKAFAAQPGEPKAAQRKGLSAVGCHSQNQPEQNQPE